ncbi:MAG TPA: putative DNA modification/repair radical SAM protein [Lachnospiraceae bacterium]|uniref:putative DNA modification/repair radical SAM protein n=1 Tax=Anaerosporobacter sp. TaxID=1872529 RepID=UPI000ED430C3|nr:putative DNA modification/repair radical SAM protein [Anaerosporobacter sp.]HAB61370.1 putative DNA modification/repair radical SAM protein [Lachnospiraceae bacterium]
MHIQENLTIQQKLEILSDAAKYDVACTSSGVDRQGDGKSMGNSVASGICHTFSADGRCISLLKILYTNECIFDCKYCINRSSNDVKRTSFTPEEVCSLTMEFYRRNYIEGLFLSSGILRNPNYTMDLIYQTLYQLRMIHQFNGYIHVKAIPGTDPELVDKIGWLADRMSVNLELPTADGLKMLAPNKNRTNILRPMKQIQNGIYSNRQQLGIKDKQVLLPSKEIAVSNQQTGMVATGLTNQDISSIHKENALRVKRLSAVNMKKGDRVYVPAGQSTQMIIGATPENDFELVSVAEALYRNFNLKRVFYSAFIKVNEDSMLPTIAGGPPLLREHRLYQADWLMRYYGFSSGELLSEKQPNFNVLLDPKCDWALRNLHLFPVEINKADYYTLLRVPGIGVKSVSRIMEARKHAKLDFADLKKIGVVLKRAMYFITCSGKTMYAMKFNENFITNQLTSLEDKIILGLEDNTTYQQLSLFDVKNFNMGIKA